METPDHHGSRTDAPAVVAAVVTEGDPELESCLASLAAQDYPSLTILVLDAGPEDGRVERRARVAAVAPSALVRALDGAPDRVSAANDVLTTVEGAPFLCFVAADVELDPRAIGVLVEEAYRSNAAICGPKVVDRDHPDVLVEVGLAVDHYGVPFTGIDPGEVDQEQHDAVRDVFFVSTAALLVRSDLFLELGGFDPACAPGFEDLDLCWRARLAGARVLVVPDARVARPRRAAARPDTRVDSLAAATAARARVVLKLYSIPALVWVLPMATLLVVGEAIGYVATRRARAARALLAGWFGALLTGRAHRDARAAAQSLRRVDDREIRAFMVRGSARARAVVIRRRHHNARLDGATVAARDAFGEVRAALRSPDVIAGLVFVALLLMGARRFVTSGVPSVGGFQAWPGAHDLLGAWGGHWRFAGLGSASPAPAVLGLFGAVSSLVLGDTDLARTAIVFGAGPLGALGAYRLARPLAARPLPAIAAMVAYAGAPLLRNAYADTDLGVLVFFALAPFVARRCWSLAVAGVDRGTRLRTFAGLVALTALTASVAPYAVLLPVAIAVAMVLAVPFAGRGDLDGLRAAARVVLASVGALVGSFVLLWPWSGSLLGAEASALALRPRPTVDPLDLLAFRTGPAGAGIVPLLVLAAAALPLVVATGERFAWALRGWMLAVVSFGFAYVPGRLAVDLPQPPVEGVLVPAALGLALAVGIGLGAFLVELRSFVFGLRQGLAVVCALCAVTPAVGLLPDVFDGGYQAPATTWDDALGFLARQARADGGFRVLWVGDPEVLPVDATTSGPLGYAFTRNGAGDVRDLLPAPLGAGDRVAQRALGIARAGRTARLGHLLGPMGVRYLAVVDRAAPDSATRAAPDPRFADALTTQLDLTVARRTDGLVLYENEAWAPTAGFTTVPSVTELALADDDPIATAARAELAGAVEPLRGQLRDAVGPDEAATALLAETYADGWSAAATAGGATGRAVVHDRAFGWSNAFAAEEPMPGIALRYDAGGLHALRVVLPAILWCAVLVLAAGRRRRAPRAVHPLALALALDSDSNGGVHGAVAATRSRSTSRVRRSPEEVGDGPRGDERGDEGELADESELAELEALVTSTGSVGRDDAAWSELDWSGLDDGDEAKP